MDQNKLNELKELAQKATPGPYKCEEMTAISLSNTDTDNSYYIVCTCDNDNIAEFDDAINKKANAEYFTAANPSVILALIDHIKQMKREQVWLAEQILCCSDEKTYCTYDCDRCFNIDTVEGWIEEARKEVNNGNQDNTKPTE